MIVADSYSTADAVKLAFGTKSDRLAVVPLAANNDPKSISVDTLKELNIDQPYLLFVGTLEPRKNLARLLAAYELMPASVKAQASVVIVGGKGWGAVNLKDEIHRLKLSNYVKLLGYVNDEVLNALYSNAQFLAMPSLYEGFGLPLLEAMVYGRPVLTANNSSMPEVAGEAGLLVDALDIHSIRSGLLQLITDKNLLSKLAGKAKKNARRFCWDKSARELIVCFEKAIVNRKLIK
jgi:glycosyltransferase involved in cell wall biosynthesis